MRIRLLGRLQAETGEQPILRFETKNAALILLKLGLQPDKSVHRDELAELLWPEDFLDATRVRLRQELARLRRALGSAQTLIESDRERVWLTRPGVSTDLEQVTTMLRELPDSGAERLASLEQIVAMWDGPLAEGINEVWVVRERDRWNSLHARTLGQLAFSRAQFGQSFEASAALSEAKRLGLDIADIAVVEQMLQRPVRTEPVATKKAVVKVEPQPVSWELPNYVGAFFGRDSELARLEAMLVPDQPNAARLVTITGMGGIGKTRLAVETARRLAKDFGGRAGFVSLGEVDASKSFESILREKLKADSALAFNEPTLLVLDEIDLLVDQWANPIRQHLEAFPKLVILATSRQALRLSGERELHLEPLATPSVPATAEQMMSFPGVALFVDRAKWVHPELASDERTLRDILQLVQKLDGIPLAIQLAAARASMLSPREMLQQLESRFKFLVSKSNDGPSRHKALFAALEWSVVQLDPGVQTTFYELAIFRGGSSLDLATLLCSSPDWAHHAEQLRDRSLVMVEDSPLGMRVKMLETMRSFARETMGESLWQELRVRHAKIVSQWSESADPKLAAAELENLRKAAECKGVLDSATAQRLQDLIETLQPGDPR